MKLFFIGSNHEVTGSCHYLEVGNKKLCVDCGMEQGQDVYENHELPVNPVEIDYILLTHAHIDHSGLLPLMYAKGFRGKVFATKATVDLCDIMLRDSAHIQVFEAEWRNRKALRSGGEPYVPLYTMEDAFGAIRLLVPCEYNEVITISDEIRIRFTDVGHLLGSSSIEVFAKEGNCENGKTIYTERTIVFSGDIGNTEKPILRDPVMTSDGDYVVMESTYGNRLHGEHPDYVGELANIIEETFRCGGNVVIPAFAVGRTQELLYFIRQIKERNLVKTNPEFEVYVDSPLAVEATSIFGKNVKSCFDKEAKALVAKGINPIGFPGLKLSITSQDSMAINVNHTPKVIISASGMCEAGRIRHHLKHNLWKKESTIVFCGYQAYGTLGRKIQEGAAQVKLFGDTIDVSANIVTIQGISGHADKKGLLHWIDSFVKKPKMVFVVHGEDTVCSEFSQCLKEEYGYDSSAPFSGSVFDLINGVYSYEAEPVVIHKKLESHKKARNIYDRLVEAGERLISIIKKNKGLSNKDVARFTDQIHSICDKWDRW